MKVSMPCRKAKPWFTSSQSPQSISLAVWEVKPVSCILEKSAKMCSPLRYILQGTHMGGRFLHVQWLCAIHTKMERKRKAQKCVHTHRQQQTLKTKQAIYSPILSICSSFLPHTTQKHGTLPHAATEHWVCLDYSLLAPVFHMNHKLHTLYNAIDHLELDEVQHNICGTCNNE